MHPTRILVCNTRYAEEKCYPQPPQIPTPISMPEVFGQHLNVDKTLLCRLLRAESIRLIESAEHSTTQYESNAECYSTVEQRKEAHPRRMRHMQNFLFSDHYYMTVMTVFTLNLQQTSRQVIAPQHLSKEANRRIRLQQHVGFSGTNSSATTSTSLHLLPGNS